MSGVDDRIVSIKFDNANFQNKMAETIKSLDKLRASLDFANSKRSLDDLSTAGKNFNMGNMGASVEGVSAKFIALSTIAITALSQITSRAISAGAQLLKSFTIGPILDGFREFETNMNSIQTILANTRADGSTLADVNAALQKLNEYSDKTIYNFSQMARNIGTFTAAGVNLNDSVNAIKGIANLAAISGSNAEQASTAMYQLSQALAAGKVSLMDWNSVVNAGMGGEVFKKALFETGKAMKTITDVPLSASFEDWEKKGGTFREQMEKGWITADVLKTTLGAFSGDLDKAALKSLGFSEAAAQQMVEMGQLGQAAATEVKTFTQLIGTVKEAVGSGWSTSFRLIIGDFEESKALFTSINSAIGSFVSKSADARNELIQGWKNLGGRTELIEGFKKAFEGIGSLLKPIGEAFREIFPATTSLQLMHMTEAFGRFAEKLKIGGETADKIKSVFRGFFSVLEIGWEIIKGIFSVIGDVVSALVPAGSGLLSFGASTGDFLTKLNDALVAGGGIKDFFEKLGEVITAPIKFLSELTAGIVAFFSVGTTTAVSESIERIGDRADQVTGIWNRMMERFKGVFDVLDKAWEVIADWFGELGNKLANAFKPGDFDAAVDIVNVGLLGGIGIMLKNFFKNGLKLDFSGGLIDKISETFSQLTGTLKAMQTDLKANALLKIAGAVGILTASLVVLSLIDSKALTKALAAMAVGFGQLIGVMTLLDTLISSSGAAIKIGILGAVFIELAIAMGILSIAIKNLSGLKWDELAKGLVGIGVGLGILVVGIKYITADTAGLIRAGAAMIAISAALYVLSKAVESFGEMSWSEIGKGLVSVAIGLGLVVTAMNKMPSGGVLSGVGFILIATGLRVLAEAVKAFGDLSLVEIGKGMLGIAGGLVIIAGAMKLMPPHMIAMATGILVISVAMNAMALAVKSMGEADLGTLAKGIGAFAAMLLILSLAMKAMNGTAAGAGALLVVSGALLILTHVLKELGNMSIAQLATGMIAIAAALTILGLAAHLLTPVIPMLSALGGALALLGLGFALFGAGAMLVAKAFELMAKAGKAGALAIVDIVKVFATAKVEIVKAMADAIIGLAEELLKAVPLLVRLFEAILLQLLETIIKLTPVIAKAFVTVITEGLRLMRELYPDLLATGIEMLLTFLRGIRDNISEIVTAGVEVITAFAEALVSNMPTIVGAGLSVILSFIAEIGNHVGELVAAGFKLLTDIILGITNNIFRVSEMATQIITKFITTIAENTDRIITAGINTILNFLTGIHNNIGKVITKGADIIIAFVQGIGENALRITNAAADTVIKFMNGLASSIRSHSAEFRKAGLNIADAIVDGMTGGILDKAKDVASAAVNVAKGAVNKVLGFLGAKSPSRLFMEIGGYMAQGMAIGMNKDKTAANSAVTLGQRVVDKIQETLSQIPGALDDLHDFNPTITPVLDLTKVKAASSNIKDLMKLSSITPNVSFEQANIISKTNELQESLKAIPVETGVIEMKFEQNIFSPTALTVNDIYRNTKSQITLAKEELGIT